MYLYIYIYIFRERERELYICICIYHVQHFRNFCILEKSTLVLCPSEVFGRSGRSGLQRQPCKPLDPTFAIFFENMTRHGKFILFPFESPVIDS